MKKKIYSAGAWDHENATVNLAYDEGLSHVGAWDQSPGKPVPELNGGPVLQVKLRCCRIIMDQPKLMNTTKFRLPRQSMVGVMNAAVCVCMHAV